MPYVGGRIAVGEPNLVGAGRAAGLVAEVVGYRGETKFDTARPDGTPRKLLDVSKLTALGWSPRIDLKAGIGQTYDWYRASLGGKY